MREYNLHGRKVLCFTHDAMATSFELNLIHSDSQYCAQLAKEIFGELDLLERDLSRFVENSDISRINHLKKGESTIISLPTFNCLKIALNMYYQTSGVFDVGAGEIITSWKEKSESSRKNYTHKPGIENLLLDESEFSVTVNDTPVNLDFGGLGKGFALDHLKQMLVDWEVTRVLLQGGNSSVLMLDGLDENMGWPLSITDPDSKKQQIIENLSLSNISISSSGIKKGTHIVDPRNGRPADHYSSIWVKTSEAVYSDMLSTAFMMYSTDEMEAYCASNKDTGCLVVEKNGKIKRIGSW